MVLFFYDQFLYNWMSARRERAVRVLDPSNNFHSSCHFRRTLARRQSHPSARSFS